MIDAPPGANLLFDELLHAPTHLGAWTTFRRRASTNRLASRQQGLLCPWFFHLTLAAVSFTLFCPRLLWHSAPFMPSLIICHCVVILSTCIDPVVTPSNCFVDSEVYLIIFSSMAINESSSPPSRVILTPNENKVYIHLTQVAKFAFISSIAQTGNASVCLSHSSRP